jgi:hypothetical protein
VKNIKRIAAATAITTGLGLAGLGAASVAGALPGPGGPLPDYHWCPGQWWDPGWGQNWGGDRCHDDYYFDGEPRDQGHWHGYGQWHPDGPGPWDHPGGYPGGPGWGPGGPGWGPPPPPPGW